MKKVFLLWAGFLMLPVLLVLFVSTGEGHIGYPEVSVISGISVLSLEAGYFVRFLLNRAEKKYPYIMFVVLLFVSGLVLVISFVCFRLYIILSVYYLVQFFIGSRVFSADRIRLINTTYVLISSVLYLIASAALKSYADEKTLFQILVLSYLFMMFLWFFLNNHKNISRLMEMRNYDEKYLPEGIRKYNFVLTAVVCVIAFFFVMLYEKLESILKTIIKTLAAFLIKLLKSGRQADVTEEKELIVKNEPELQPPSDISSSADVLQGLFWVTVILVFVYLIILAVRKNIFGILIRNFIAFFRRVFGGGYFREAKEKTIGYTDVLEFTIQEDDIRSMYFSKKHKYKRKLKKYNSMSDDANKLRFGYGVITEYIKHYDKSFSDSDTPDEISQKLKNPFFSESTGDYCRIRYGQCEFDKESIDRMDRTIKDCLKKI
ncbi:MAG: hypothetical protein E7505_08025 [Ruminococcus sp.]|nr:hypothetical protein [Ruminococcus sp.]